jgi:two-component system, LuxR family, sensor kinase FixL
MSWITIVWSMNAAACLTLAGIYLLVWCKQRQDWAHLLFSLTAVAAAAIAAFELAMMHAETVGQCEALMRWIHVPVWVLVISFVSFVRLYLHAGRRWLAWSICCLRTLVLILNFVFTPNLNFRHITSLRQFSWGGGEIISVPVGVANPWGLLSSVSLLLLLIFFVDATITVWRRGDRRRALVVGGSMIFGAILAWHVPLVIWGIIDIPLFLCFAYSGIVAAMAYELSYDLLHAAQLSRQLQASEADLRETEQRMELAASAAKLGMWMWDIPRNEIWLTDKGRALFGFGASEKLDFDRFRSVLHPEDRQSVLQAVENTLHTGAEYEAEYRVVLPDGQLRWISGRGQVEFNGDGQPARVRGASVDITKRKQAEEQAARQRNEMVHLSRVSTLGELSGSIAHELSLPLSAILCNAQAAQRILANGQVDHTELREILNEVVSEDKRACEVIRRLRLWLKKGEVQQHSLRINNVVQDVLKLLRSDLIDQKVIVDCELARNLPAVIGDPVQLQQVLLNLVVNACDAMVDCSTPERRLLIRTGTENGSGAVVVSVTDRGGSIPAEKMKQIFEPFFSTKAKGMGLGLSVCHSIIAAHRGQLWATNNADCGATFHFSLPIGIPGTAVPISSNGQLDDHA